MIRWLLCAVLVVLTERTLGQTEPPGDCIHSRQSGFFMNGYEDLNDPNWAGPTGADTTPGFGDSNHIHFDTAYNYLAQSGNELHIVDDGKIVFTGSATGTPAALSPSGYAFGTTTDFAFAAARWWSDQSGAGTAYTYEYSYQQIKRADTESGGFVIASQCALQRIAAIIDDCEESEYETTTIEEALIVTFKTARGADIEYTQVVVAVNDDGTADPPNTYVLFLYNDPPTAAAVSNDGEMVVGILNGLYSSAGQNSFQRICLDGGADANLGERSNCHCGGHNAGTYVFQTKDHNGAAALVNKECTTSATCIAPSPTTYTFNKNMYCRPFLEPMDTCREHVDCKYATSGTSITINIHFTDNPGILTDLLQFVTPRTSGTDPFVLNNDPSCQGAVANTAGGQVVVLTFADSAALTTCGIVSTAAGADTTLNFELLVHQSSNPNHIQDGDRYLDVTCLPTDLPNMITETPQFQTFPTAIHSSSLITVDFFINNAQAYADNVNSIFGTDKGSPDDKVILGQDVFMILCYDFGGTVIDNVDPYGIYPHTCTVSNNNGFSSTGAGNYAIDILDSNGCRTAAGTDPMPFGMETEFMSTTAPGTYEWCISSGKIDMSKWVNKDEVYFRCSVGYCRNKAVQTGSTSKCEEPCAGGTSTPIDSLQTDRKKRDISDRNVTEVYEVTTKVRVVLPSKDMSSEGVPCSQMTVVIPSIVALIVALLLATAVAVVLFLKVQRRGKK